MAKDKMGSGGFKSSRGKVFGTLEPVFDEVWWAWGTTKFAPGILFPRNMSVIRGDDGLVVIHPVLLPDAEQMKLEALGPIRHIVRLGAFHGMDDLLYAERYKPTFWAPPGVDVAEGLKVDRELVPGGAVPISGATIFDFETSRSPELALLVPRHGGILFTCDSVQNWETSAGCSFLGGLMSKMMGFRGRACIGPGWRKQSEPKDTPFGPSFTKLVELEWKHLLSGHGAPMKDTARDDLRASAKKIYG